MARIAVKPKKAAKTSPKRKAAPEPVAPAAPAWQEVPPQPVPPQATWAAPPQGTWAVPPPRMPMRPDQERQYAMFLHLSAFAGIFVGGLMFLGPLIMWILKKDESAFVDRHGRAALNFWLSLLAYGVAFFVLFMLITILTLGIGALLLIPLIFIGGVAVMVLVILFPILACLKAQAGQESTYPLSIRFIGPPAPR